MQQNLSESKLRICYKCNYEGITPNKQCPRCSRFLYTQARIRVLGAVLIFLGGFIAVMMAAIIFFVFNIASGNAQGQRFTGDEMQLLFVLGILGLTLAVGVSFMIAGLWQVIFGRRNKIIVWICLALVFITFALGGILQVVL